MPLAMLVSPPSVPKSWTAPPLKVTAWVGEPEWVRGSVPRSEFPATRPALLMAVASLDGEKTNPLPNGRSGSMADKVPSREMPPLRNTAASL